MNSKEKAERKNKQLVGQLKDARNVFCKGLGTRRVKLMLNRIGKTNKLAILLRTALEVEDCNIQAKRYLGDYKDHYYEKKSRMIRDLVVLCREMNLTYGISEVENYSTTHVIYFELPNCKQISFHIIPMETEDLPQYDKEWDGKVNSTLGKLEEAILKSFPNEIDKELDKYNLRYK